MRHTYLFEEGAWNVSGRYIDRDGREFALRGDSEIRHRKDRWVMAGSMEVLSDEPLRFFSVYDIVPFLDASDHTAWVSSNPAIGRLNGMFCTVGEALLSSWQSEGGQFRGSEALRMIDGWTYVSHGALFEGTHKVASWDLELTRELGDLPPGRL